MKKSKFYKDEIEKLFAQIAATDPKTDDYATLVRRLKEVEEAREINQRIFTDKVKTGVQAVGAVITGGLSAAVVAAKLNADRKDLMSSMDKETSSWAFKNAVK